MTITIQFYFMTITLFSIYLSIIYDIALIHFFFFFFYTKIFYFFIMTQRLFIHDYISVNVISNMGGTCRLNKHSLVSMLILKIDRIMIINAYKLIIDKCVYVFMLNKIKCLYVCQT